MVMWLVGLLGWSPVALAQDDEDGRRPSRERLLDELEDSDLFDFSPARDLFDESDDEEGDDEEDREGVTSTKPGRRDRSPSSPSTPRSPKSPSAPEIEPGGGASRPINAEDASTVKTNFEGMTLLEFLQVMSEMRDDLNFIVAPDVSGTVTIKTSRRTKKEDIPDLIQTVLEVNGLAAIPSPPYYKIVKLTDSAKYNVETLKGKTAASVPDDDRLVTQIIELDHVSADEVQDVLRDFSPSGSIVAHEGTNTLVISSSASAIRRMLKIIEHIDVPGSLDDENLFVYFLKNADAEDLAQILNSLYEDKNSNSRNSRASTSNSSRRDRNISERRNNQNRSRNSRKSSGGLGNSKSSETPADFAGAAIVPYVEINALIVKAPKRTYANIKRTIEELDRPPKQVFIEMLVAEITLDEGSQFGVEWAGSALASPKIGDRHGILEQKFSRGAASRDSSSSVFDGFRYMLSETNRLQAVVEAQANESRLNVLASPNILASDNTEASINITNDVPVQKNTISEQGTSNFSYEYKEAGIKLKVIPHINEDGMVRLEVEQEVSEVSGAAGNGQPTFVKRTATTTVVVGNGQTLAIGGLIDESETRAEVGIPILSKIPILGALFRSSSAATNKTELVMLLTPHVIRSAADGDRVTENFTRRLDDLRPSVEKSLEEITGRVHTLDISASGDQGALFEERPLLAPDTTEAEVPDWNEWEEVIDGKSP